MEESVRRQRESIEKQRAAVQAQLPASAQKPESFFTVPWSQPLTVAAIAPSPSPDRDPVPPDEIGAIVAEASAREGLTPDLLRSVMEKESSYLPCAVPVKGAQGLMQLMPSTAADLGVGDLFDPLENVEAGARFLKQLLVRYDGSLPLALAAYNAGPGRVDSARGIPLIPETRNYVTEILGRFGSR
jgi:soluble lytic murein transglycosylase-like protein